MSESAAIINQLADLQLPVPAPATHSQQTPQFVTQAQCKAWLKKLAITNAPQSQVQLLRELDLLNHQALPAAERLAIAEFLRNPIHFVHDQCAKRYARRLPLPLPQGERIAFDTSQALWQALQTAYLLALQEFLQRQQQHPLTEEECQQAALAATRAMSTALVSQLDHLRSGFAPAPDFWRRLTRSLYVAELLGVLQRPVADRLTHAESVTAQACHVEAVLLALARPHELSLRELDQVIYWAHRWATKIRFSAQPPADARTPALCCDLAADAAPAFASPQQAAQLRWLDMSELRKTIKQRLSKLAEGVPPADLKLGRDFTRASGEPLLQRMYGLWCKGSGKPKPERAARASWTLLASFEAAHFHLSGQPFDESEGGVYLSKHAADEIATFGHVATRHQDVAALAAQYPREPWQQEDGQLSQVELSRSLAGEGLALAAERLVAVQQAGHDWQLGRVLWLYHDLASQRLHCALRLFAGLPQAVSVILPSHGMQPEQRVRGFCLPPVEHLQQVASLLLPSGSFLEGRLVTVKGVELSQLRLLQLIERGSNFERCAYAEA